LYVLSQSYQTNSEKSFNQGLESKKDNCKIINEFKGYIGINPLMIFPYINLPFVCNPEAMHGIFLGVMKTMVSHWLENLKLNVKEINKRIEKFSFPSHILRQIPQNITKKLKSFDYENLLFYGYGIFKNLIPDDQFFIFEVFSYFISSLCSLNLKKNQISSLQDLIENLVPIMYRKFPRKKKSINFHNLLHLPAFALEYGSLLRSSSYMVESQMGLIAEQVKSGVKIPEQSMNKMNIINSLEIVLKKTIFDDKNRNFLMKNKVLEDEKDFKIFRDKKKFDSIIKLRLNKKIICSEHESVNRKCNDHLIKLKDNRFIKIINIKEINDEIIFHGLKFETVPHSINFNSKIYYFHHIHEATIAQNEIVKFKKEEIASSISIFEIDQKIYVFDLFNQRF